jgi:hypothetical protein
MSIAPPTVDAQRRHSQTAVLRPWVALMTRSIERDIDTAFGYYASGLFKRRTPPEAFLLDACERELTRISRRTTNS